MLKFKKLALPVTLLTLTFVLTACNTAPTPAINVTAFAAGYCATESLQTYSMKDTPETIRQVDVHNAKYRALCSAKS